MLYVGRNNYHIIFQSCGSDQKIEVIKTPTLLLQSCLDDTIPLKTCIHWDDIKQTSNLCDIVKMRRFTRLCCAIEKFCDCNLRNMTMRLTHSKDSLKDL